MSRRRIWIGRLLVPCFFFFFYFLSFPQTAAARRRRGTTTPPTTAPATSKQSRSLAVAAVEDIDDQERDALLAQEFPSAQVSYYTEKIKKLAVAVSHQWPLAFLPTRQRLPLAHLRHFAQRDASKRSAWHLRQQALAERGSLGGALKPTRARRAFFSGFDPRPFGSTFQADASWPDRFTLSPRDGAKLEAEPLSSQWEEPAPFWIQAIHHPEDPGYIGMVKAVWIAQEFEQVIALFEDFERYPERFAGIRGASREDPQPGVLISQVERDPPLFFLPTVQIKQVYFRARVSPDLQIYRYQLISGNQTQRCDGLVVLERLGAQSVRLVSFDFFKSDWGFLTTAVGFERIWLQVFENFYFGDLLLKFKAEHPTDSKAQTAEAARAVMSALPLELPLSSLDAASTLPW